MAAIYQVDLRARGQLERLYVLAPNEQVAERIAWTKLETITGTTYRGFRYAIVSIVRGTEDGSTKKRLQSKRR